MADMEFKVSARSESAARTVVTARNFALVVDEPPQLGGSDLGPNPVEYVLAALTGCLNVVAHLVARELGFDIQRLEIEAAGWLNPQRLLNQPTQDRAGYKKIKVTLRVQTNADEATLARWLKQVEARCPVSDNLGNVTPLEVAYAKL